MKQIAKTVNAGTEQKTKTKQTKKTEERATKNTSYPFHTLVT